VLENLGAMMHGESALLKAELRETGRSYATAAVASVVAVIAVGAFVNFLGLAAVAGLLAADLPLWAAALICAGALVLIAAGAAIYALGAVRSADPVPRRTIDNIRRDFRAMSDALRREGD
jgi:peptidoglycan/LPS O-acetylase OafA/YrhL